MPQRDAEIAMLRREIELMMGERQALLRVAGASAALIASLDSKQLPVAAVEAADMVATSINALAEESLQDALAAVNAEIEDDSDRRMMGDPATLAGALLAAPEDPDWLSDETPPGSKLTPAAVLVPIIRHAEEDRVLLTRRTAHLRDHAGQISFPGGRVEAGDENPLQTALRETEEEIGLARRHVEVLGYLPDYRTSTGFVVTPVVAWVHPPFQLTPDRFEVAEIFEVPLAFLLDSGNFQRHTLAHEGAMRSFDAVPYGEYFIWGATAGILRSLQRRVVGCADARACGILRP